MSPVVTWSFEPSVLIGVLALVLLYAAAWRRARRRGERHPPSLWRAVLFAGGILTILVALVSPLDSLGDQLMVMHMVQHMLLLDLAPILLILGLTKTLLRPVTRRLQTIERQAGFFGHPAFAVIFYAGLLWLWHVPALYDQAQGNSLLHVFEHLCFFAAGSLYWWHVFSPIRSRARLTGLGQVGYMAGAKLLVGILGIALAFAPRVLYPFYAHQPHYWGLSPLEDQMMAGLVMALEQSLVMGVALVYLFVQMLNESERNAQRAERFEIA
ncbi:MAG TPA: cytochrome c oxidase assembly protein [Solirubrobacteraceae bacterium]|nr:cytochrome c oxidase assembly protein [Solirubrobacteraceae bacterium]